MPFDNVPPIVTVFGGGGFVGRYVCEQLLKAGMRVRACGAGRSRMTWGASPTGRS